MRATKRIKNKDGKTVGFIINGGIYPYQSVLDHIEEVENLKVIGSNKVVSTSGSLPSVSLSSLQGLMSKSSISSKPTSYAIDEVKLRAERREFKRDVQTQFEEWYNRRDKKVPLILYVKGARQTGKTTEIAYFAYQRYKNIIYINLLADDRLQGKWSDMAKAASALDTFTDFCREVLGVEYIPGRSTVLIIDEIQQSKSIFESLRSFRFRLGCDIIISGSYLGLVVNKGYFLPMGDTYDIEMTPLSFREFCCALGHEKEICAAQLINNSQSVHQILWQDYEVYRRIGGYPSVVRKYCDSGAIKSCTAVLVKLIETFISESAVYVQGAQEKLPFNAVFQALAEMQLSEKRGRTFDTSLVADFMQQSNKLVDPKSVRRAVSWLYSSHIIGTVNSYNPELSHVVHDQRSYFCDLGVLNVALSQVVASSDSKEGLITETFAFNELKRHWVTGEFYGLPPAFALYGNYELDFVVPDKDAQCFYFGVEVKKGNAETKSLDVFTKKKFVKRGIIAGNTRGGITEKGYFHIPVYMVGLGYPYSLE